MAEVRAGDRAEALIERVVPGGDGLAHVSGVVALVPGGLPGDRVRLRVTEASVRLVRGTVEEVLSPGEARRPEAEMCPRARDRSCGGCDWPAARLEHHRELKTSLVLDAMRRLAGLRAEDLPEPRWLGSARNYRLRNRLHLDREGRLGFYAPRSNAVTSLETCEIVSKALLQRLPAIRDYLAGFGPAEGELWTLEDREGRTLLGQLRLGESRLGGGHGLQISSRGERVSSEGRGSVSKADERIASNVRERGRGPFDGFRVTDAAGRVIAEVGPASLSIVAGGASFDVSVSSFFQGNLYLLDAFLEEIRAALRGGGGDSALRAEGKDSALRAVPGREDGDGPRVFGDEPRPGRLRLVDLYAGVGFLTRPLLELARAAGGEVTAVEIEESCSHSLSRNVQSWVSEGLPLARCRQTTAESFLSSQKSLNSSDSPNSPDPPIDVIVADPPRAGLSAGVRAGILRLLPRRLVMVSCDPPTLARDLSAMKERYRVDRLTLLDLFPQTHHVEAVALLARREVG